jgi:predicted regulator of Ras-like GTPase activity (Roadblock/LC7/MglB family)
MSATPQQVRQWSEEVAADPGSRSFLPLAEAYRGMGKRDAALRLVLRGLERHPHDVEAHYLLGLLYREGGEGTKAFDEWDIALALAPEHRGARREIGLLCAERGEWTAAIRHLERALGNDMEDGEVRRALEMSWARSRGQSVPPPAPAAAPAPAPPARDGGAPADDFDALTAELRALGAERGMVGAVMLDAQGYVVAGEMPVGGRDRAAEVAAVLSGASAEAERAVRHLKLGAWKGILVETPDAVVRLAPTGDGGMVAVAGRRDVPMGWVLRVAGRAREAAARFLARTGGGP